MKSAPNSVTEMFAILKLPSKEALIALKKRAIENIALAHEAARAQVQKLMDNYHDHRRY